MTESLCGLVFVSLSQMSLLGTQHLVMQLPPSDYGHLLLGEGSSGLVIDVGEKTQFTLYSATPEQLVLDCPYKEN